MDVSSAIRNQADINPVELGVRPTTNLRLPFQYFGHDNAPFFRGRTGHLFVAGGDGGELNSKHGPTVAHALRDLSIALARLANTLDKASPNQLVL